MTGCPTTRQGYDPLPRDVLMTAPLAVPVAYAAGPAVSAACAPSPYARWQRSPTRAWTGRVDPGPDRVDREPDVVHPSGCAYVRRLGLSPARATGDRTAVAGAPTRDAGHAENGLPRRWDGGVLLAMSSPSPIFVAGTGRSGTSRIANIIGEHPLIHRIPMETKLIIDPGGLRDLADALTDRYDPAVGEDALHRLSDFLTVFLPGRRDDRGKTIPELVGQQRYRDAVQQLWPQLIAATFDEPAPPTGFGDADRPAGPFGPPSRRRVVPRYFSDRGELIAVLRGTVNTLFAGAAADAGKPIWAEKTPFNLFYMDFLWELFPEATIVHIKRHPVSVLASHLDQTWAPSTIDGVLAYLKPIYQRWLGWKDSTDLTGRRYIEVKAEDLAADWPGQRRAFFERLGFDDFATPSEFQAHRLSNRNGQFDGETRRNIQKDLGKIIHAMGYE